MIFFFLSSTCTLTHGFSSWLVPVDEFLSTRSLTHGFSSWLVLVDDFFLSACSLTCGFFYDSFQLMIFFVFFYTLTDSWLFFLISSSWWLFFYTLTDSGLFFMISSSWWFFFYSLTDSWLFFMISSSWWFSVFLSTHSLTRGFSSLVPVNNFLSAFQMQVHVWASSWDCKRSLARCLAWSARTC